MKTDKILGEIMCDKCDEIDGDYEVPLTWNAEKQVFICKRGHKENWSKATRQIDFGDFEGYFRLKFKVKK